MSRRPPASAASAWRTGTELTRPAARSPSRRPVAASQRITVPSTEPVYAAPRRRRPARTRWIRPSGRDAPAPGRSAGRRGGPRAASAADAPGQQPVAIGAEGDFRGIERVEQPGPAGRPRRSQRWTAVSSPPVASSSPPGAKAMAMTGPPSNCSNGGAAGVRSRVFQTRAVPSRPAVASRLPSGLKAGVDTAARCGTTRAGPVAAVTSQVPKRPSFVATAMRNPSASNAAAFRRPPCSRIGPTGVPSIGSHSRSRPPLAPTSSSRPSGLNSGDPTPSRTNIGPIGCRSRASCIRARKSPVISSTARPSGRKTARWTAPVGGASATTRPARVPQASPSALAPGPAIGEPVEEPQPVGAESELGQLGVRLAWRRQGRRVPGIPDPRDAGPLGLRRDQPAIGAELGPREPVRGDHRPADRAEVVGRIQPDPRQVADEQGAAVGPELGKAMVGRLDDDH